jgi:hypothetical protein
MKTNYVNVDMTFVNDSFSTDNLSLRFDSRKYYSNLKTNDVIRVQVDNVINMYVYVTVRVERHIFKTIENEMIKNEHDVTCREKETLFTTLKKFYKDSFNEDSEVVLIYYTINDVDNVKRMIRLNTF